LSLGHGGITRVGDKTFVVARAEGRWGEIATTVVQNAPTSLLNAKKKSVQEELNIIADQLALEYAIDPHPTITPPASLCLHHLMPYIFFMMDL
jgi:hypothetical protein